MNKEIDFYYDFISPYSYIAHERIKKLKNIKFNYKPILVGGLHNLGGITAPALIKPKKKFLINDCKMVADKYEINFKFNNKFPINSLRLMRGVISINKDKEMDYINKFFDAYWGSNTDLSDENEINKILKSLQINENIFFKKINNQKIKDKLKDLTQEAFDKDIFGAPTFVINKKIFWGQDRIEYVIDEYKKN